MKSRRSKCDVQGEAVPRQLAVSRSSRLGSRKFLYNFRSIECEPCVDGKCEPRVGGSTEGMVPAPQPRIEDLILPRQFHPGIIWQGNEGRHFQAFRIESGRTPGDWIRFRLARDASSGRSNPNNSKLLPLGIRGSILILARISEITSTAAVSPVSVLLLCDLVCKKRHWHIGFYSLGGLVSYKVSATHAARLAVAFCLAWPSL